MGRWICGRRPSKYGAVRVAGYDSKAEASRAAILRLLAIAGEITDLREHVALDVHPEGCQPIRYKADFVYRERGRQVIEDVKGGVLTEAWRLKWKLTRWKYPEAILRVAYCQGAHWTIKDEEPCQQPSA